MNPPAFTIRAEGDYWMVVCQVCGRRKRRYFWSDAQAWITDHHRERHGG